jgi:hypothetical protein
MLVCKKLRACGVVCRNAFAESPPFINPGKNLPGEIISRDKSAFPAQFPADQGVS